MHVQAADREGSHWWGCGCASWQPPRSPATYSGLGCSRFLSSELCGSVAVNGGSCCPGDDSSGCVSPRRRMASVNDGSGEGETPRSVLHRAGSEWTALDLNESGDEADERTPLIPAGLPYQSPRFRRSSLYEGRPELNPDRKASWAELMKEAESLDTDVLINVVSIEERRMQDKPKEDRPFIKKSKKRGLIKWMFNALIGIMVGITAFTVEKSIDVITEARQEWMWRIMMNRTDYRDQCSPWSTETWSTGIWQAAGYPPADAIRLAAQSRGGIHCLLNPGNPRHFLHCLRMLSLSSCRRRVTNGLSCVWLCSVPVPLCHILVVRSRYGVYDRRLWTGCLRFWGLFSDGLSERAARAKTSFGQDPGVQNHRHHPHCGVRVASRTGGATGTHWCWHSFLFHAAALFQNLWNTDRP